MVGFEQIWDRLRVIRIVVMLMELSDLTKLYKNKLSKTSITSRMQGIIQFEMQATQGGRGGGRYSTIKDTVWELSKYSWKLMEIISWPRRNKRSRDEKKSRDENIIDESDGNYFIRSRDLVEITS